MLCLLLAFVSVVGGLPAPEQVHLALGKSDDAINVAWVTAADVPSEVQWWGGSFPSIQDSRKSTADSRVFTQDAGRTWFTHAATMTGLERGAQYFYRVGGNGSYSEVYNFTNRREGPPYRHVIFGDLGAACGFSVCDACTAKSEVCDSKTCAGKSVGLVSEVGKAGQMLHVGDFGYDLDSDDGKTGDQFMRNIEQLAAYVPYMVSHGNHEDSSSSLAHYIERFRSQPSNAQPSTFKSSNGETTNTLYFSWNYGLVHYISISTELWFGVHDDKVNLTTQLEWLKSDLAVANKNRAENPWIIIEGHRSVYCSCDGDCDDDAKKVRKDMEPILMEYGVDFFINGHEHNYERSYPLYEGKSDRSNIDPKAPIYIVSGSAGSREMHEPFTRPQPSWSAYRSNTFGYSVATVYNATHLHWQQVQTDPTVFGTHYGDIIDDAWIIQHSHGPFDVAQAPRGEACLPASVCGSRQYDHWWSLLDVDDKSGRPSDEIITDLRQKQGEQWWAKQLQGIMDWAIRSLGAGSNTWRPDHTRPLIWENTSDDGSSDAPPLFFHAHVQADVSGVDAYV
jgi:hypothetical protein